MKYPVSIKKVESHQERHSMLNSGLYTHAQESACVCALSHLSTHPHNICTHTCTLTKTERKKKRFIDSHHILGVASKAICSSPATKES